MVVGEAPDGEDDLMGTPFSGRRGDLLRSLLGKAGIDPEGVWFTHLVKCQPKKLVPTEGNIRTCMGWLNREIAEAKPRLILALGKMPLIELLGLIKSVKLKDRAGKIYQLKWAEASLAAWYGPGFLLSRGKKWQSQTITFFSSLKGYLNEATVEVS